MSTFYHYYYKKRYIIYWIIYLFFILSPFFIKAQDTAQVEASIFPYIFTAPTIKYKLYPEIHTTQELNNRLSSIDISSEEFFHADSLIVNEDSFLKDSIYYSQFSINKRQYKSYCYFKPGLITEDSVAFLIIPGSGDNQSSVIYKGIPNYQGDISNHTIKYGDTYIFVKPNEDFLAWYSDIYKLNVYGYVNYILNRGYSYSAYYMTQAIAVAKELKGKYRKVFILGCSQGGSAALLIALQVEPTACVVSSGYSILFDQLDWSSQNQLIIPGLSEKYSSLKIRSIIQSQKTNYLFTYGMLEGDFYGLEAQYHITENFFSGVNNAFFSADFFGHTYPQPKVENFIIDILRPKPIILIKDSELNTDYLPGYIYHWYKNDSINLPDSTNRIIVIESAYYKVKVSTTSGISSFSDSIFYIPIQNFSIDTSLAVSQPYYENDSIITTVAKEVTDIFTQQKDSLEKDSLGLAKPLISSKDILLFHDNYEIFFLDNNLIIKLKTTHIDDIELQLFSIDLKKVIFAKIDKDKEEIYYSLYLGQNLDTGIYIVRIIGKYHNLAVKLLKN